VGRHFGNPFSVLGVLLHSYIFDGKSNFPGWYGLSLGAIPSTTILLLFFLLFLLFVHRSAALIAHGQIMLRTALSLQTAPTLESCWRPLIQCVAVRRATAFVCANSYYTCDNIGLVRPSIQPVIFGICLIALLVEGVQCITTV